jgi:type II secretion system protein J
MTRRVRHHGFTLLELLVASSMVAILGLSLAAAMHVGFRGRTVAHNQLRAVREAAIAMDIVQQDLQSLLPPTGILAGPFFGYAMGTTGAEADSLEFHTIGRDLGDDDSPLSDGIRRVQLVLRTDTTPRMLVRRVQRNLLASSVSEAVEEPLVRNVRAFSVRYYNGYGWLQEWDSTLRNNVLPLAMEVTLELDLPSPSNPDQPYRIRQIVPISTGRFVESDDPLEAGLE